MRRAGSVAHCRRAAVAVSGAALLVLGAGRVAAAGVVPGPGGDTAPAPSGQGSGSVLKLDLVGTCIGCTSADAGARRPQAHAAPIRLLGHEIPGGESVANASQQGALLAVPVNPLLNLAIANWQASSGVDEARSTSHAHSRAALVDLALLGETPADSMLTVALVESSSNATYTGSRSHGDAVDNGVDLTALHGAVVVTVLHSEASSEHPGSSSVLSVNGNSLLGSGETPGGVGIPITIPGVLGLTLLEGNARGGASGVAGVSATRPPGPVRAVPAAVIGGSLQVPPTGLSLGIGGLVLVVAGAAVTGLALRRRPAPG